MAHVEKTFAQEANGRIFPYSTTSSGILNTSQSVKDVFGVLVDVLVYTDGNNNATVTVYDNPSAASGTVLAKIIVKGTDLMGGEVSILVDAQTGIYVDISGTGATALIRYA